MPSIFTNVKAKVVFYIHVQYIYVCIHSGINSVFYKIKIFEFYYISTSNKFNDTIKQNYFSVARVP